MENLTRNVVNTLLATAVLAAPCSPVVAASAQDTQSRVVPFTDPAADISKRRVTLPQCPQVSQTQVTPTGISRRMGSPDRLIQTSFEPKVEIEDGTNSTAMGAKYQATWITAKVYTDKGKLVSLMLGQYIPEEKSFRQFNTPTPGQDFYDSPFVKDSTSFEVVPGTGLVYTSSNPDTKSDIVITDKTFTWKAKGVFELSGERVTPGVQSFIPVRFNNGKAGVEVYYQTDYKADGKMVDGTPLKGFVVFEHHYGAGDWLTSQIAQKKGAYIMFANEYDDGTVEQGHFFCSDTLRNAILVNDKGEEVINTPLVNAVTTATPAGAQTHAEYTIGADSEKWIFDWTPGAAKGSMGPVDKPYSMTTGQMRRAGEKRKIVRYWAASMAGNLM